MKIPIASDHAGFKAKEEVKKILNKIDIEPIDMGTHDEESVDYPDFAVPLSQKINSGEYKQGILVCGSGQGMCMTANKYSNVRAGLVYDENSARMTRQHNNANILCLPGRELNQQELKDIVTTWIQTDFEGGRHKRRTNKIHDLTEE